MRIDFNCDLGEGCGDDAAIIPLVTSASIACGAHAGDEATMRTTLRLCREHGVAAGAHPGYPDRANFGRVDMPLPVAEIERLVAAQLTLLADIDLGIARAMAARSPDHEAAVLLLQLDAATMLVGAGDGVGGALLEPVLLVWRQIAAEDYDVAAGIEHGLLLLTGSFTLLTSWLSTFTPDWILENI